MEVKSMKTSTFPAVRCEPELRQAVERELREGESLSGFVEEAIRSAIAQRRAQREFIARGLAARDAARANNDYVDADDVLADLDSRYDEAKAIRTRRR
jgi:predicted transcriptional regulator